MFWLQNQILYLLFHFHSDPLNFKIMEWVLLIVYTYYWV